MVTTRARDQDQAVPPDGRGGKGGDGQMPLEEHDQNVMVPRRPSRLKAATYAIGSDEEEDPGPDDGVQGSDGEQHHRRRSTRLSTLGPGTRRASDGATSNDDNALEGEEQRGRGRRNGAHVRPKRGNHIKQRLDDSHHANGDGVNSTGDDDDILEDAEAQDIQEEDEDRRSSSSGGSSSGQEEEEEEEEAENGRSRGRYSLRQQAKRPRYNEDELLTVPVNQGKAARQQRHGSRRQVAASEDEDEDEDDGMCSDGGRRKRRGAGTRGAGKAQPEQRYTLRDRSRMVPLSVQQQQAQQEELRRDMVRLRKRDKERRRDRSSQGVYAGGSVPGATGGSSGRHLGGGYNSYGYRGAPSDDDVPDLEGGNPWRNVQPGLGHAPWQSTPGLAGMPMTPLPALGPATAAGGAQMVPSSAAHHNHYPHALGGAPNAGPPSWEAALLGDVLGQAGNAGKEKAGNAEINPVVVDPSVNFDQVGGLDEYVTALKEMVFLPLVYPELFAKFHVKPPRGVLFYGPPGTGKTLVARALAAHASRHGGRRVAFFMRKGADVLSKWVGEAERQLRLLFEEAQKNAPSIIFFDEIDGLAPVRSSRQDQIHNSIVSTLLALMDGLDSRGQVVVIGATNRIDSIDGALRRPGRFDRELLFPLPSLKAREVILDIHTRKWTEPPGQDLLQELASATVGYCGADIKALCAEAALHAVRRRYPQIYEAEEKLLIQPEQVRVERADFLAALGAITPASNRAVAAHARPLAGAAGAVLRQQLAKALGRLQLTFPPAAACLAAAASRDGAGPGPGSAKPVGPSLFKSLPSYMLARPRLLLCGAPGCGQQQLAAAVMYAVEGLPVHAIGLPSLLADPSSRSPEEALVHAFVEARRAAPAVLYLPHLQLWWDTASPTLRATLWMLLADLPAELPLLLLATAEAEPDELEPEVKALFRSADDLLVLQPPDSPERREALEAVLEAAAKPAETASGAGASSSANDAVARTVEVLLIDPSVERAKEDEARATAELALRAAYEEDQATLRSLRMALRVVTLALLGDRRWKMFAAPVSPEDDPEYWQLVSQPMDLATILARVDGRQYGTTAQYLADISLIVQGAKEYFGDAPAGARHLSRAMSLEDEASQLVVSRVPMELATKCEAIAKKGGPAPPPLGMLLPADVAAARGKGGGGRCGGTSSQGDGERPTRASARLRGGVSVVATHTQHGPHEFEDPEAILRARRLVRKVASQEVLITGERDAVAFGAAATAVPKLGSQADESMAGGDAAGHGSQVEGEDADMVDAVQPAEPLGTATGDAHTEGGTLLEQEGAEPAVELAQEERVVPLPQPDAQAAAMAEAELCNAEALADARNLLEALVARTAEWTLEQLEVLHARLGKAVEEHAAVQDRRLVLQAARDAAVALVGSDLL